MCDDANFAPRESLEWNAVAVGWVKVLVCDMEREAV